MRLSHQTGSRQIGEPRRAINGGLRGRSQASRSRMGIDEWEPRLGIFTIRGLGPANDNLMSQGDDPGSSEAPLPIRNESRETRADRMDQYGGGAGKSSIILDGSQF